MIKSTLFVKLSLVGVAFALGYHLSGFINLDSAYRGEIELLRPTQASPVVKPVNIGLDFIPVPVAQDRGLMVARHEISVAQWRQCVAAGACQLDTIQRGTEAALDHPVTDISWQEITAFIDWYAAASQLPVRVPTKAEWLSFAADHAPVARKPLFTDPRMAWAADYDITAGPQSRLTQVIGSFGRNQHGLVDIQGNVWEWVQDCYFAQPKQSVDGPEGCIGGRVVMGERVSHMVENRRVPGNVGCYSDQPPANVGFRLVYDQA